MDKRTIDSWKEKLEAHSWQVPEQKLQQGHLDLGQVQPDEIQGEIQGAVVWLAIVVAALMRLWLDGAVRHA